MSVSSLLFIVAGLLYVAACGLFLFLLSRDSKLSTQWAKGLLWAAWGSHLLFFFHETLSLELSPLGGIQQTLALSSLLVVTAFLLASLRYRVGILGAFITPLALLFFLGAGLRNEHETVPAVRSILLPLHIGLNVLGVVAFALAFVIATTYVIQERLLRRKQLGGLFRRLPALDVLDSLSFRLVSIGFPLLTLGIVTGGMWAMRLTPGKSSFSLAQSFALLAWLVFAAVLALRLSVGWRGRRAAVGTILGFVCALLVLLAYTLRDGGY